MKIITYVIMDFNMNGYNLTRKWFDFKFENPSKVRATHTDFYIYLIDQWNRFGQKKEFGLPTSYTMECLGIGSYNTYKKILNDLVEFGFIKIVKDSKNQYVSKIIALSKNDKASDKALDEATAKASDKASDSIYKQYNKLTKEQINNILNYFNNFKKNEIEKEILKLINQEEKETIEIPNEFRSVWNKWKEYRKASKMKNYAAQKYEQIAVNKLIEMSNNNPVLAEEIINQSIVNNYQGLFTLKNNSHGNTKTPTNQFNSNQSQTRTGRQILAERLINATKANGESGSTIIDVEAL